MQLDEGGFVGPVNRKGHGLQRALVLTLLQHLARAVATSGSPEESVQADGHEGEQIDGLPGLILAIEEPELYQHPTKQRHFARVLSDLSSGSLPGVATRTQVLFASHSPLFVAMDRFDEIRLSRRVECAEAECKECQFTEASLTAVTRKLEAAYPDRARQFTEDGLRARLHIIGPELAEGFFADAVVIVEGPGDKAAISAAASLLGIDLVAAGIAVVAADGKQNIDRPYLIFREFNIPVYALWDCDREDVEINRALQRICGLEEGQLRGPVTCVTSRFACFEHKLEVTLREEIGDDIFIPVCDAIRGE